MAKKKSSDKAGYVMLGVAIDYFLFRPVRALKPLWTFWLGIVVGAFSCIGIENFAELIRSLT